MALSQTPSLPGPAPHALFHQGHHLLLQARPSPRPVRHVSTTFLGLYKYSSSSFPLSHPQVSHSHSAANLGLGPPAPRPAPLRLRPSLGPDQADHFFTFQVPSPYTLNLHRPGPSRTPSTYCSERPPATGASATTQHLWLRVTLFRRPHPSIPGPAHRLCKNLRPGPSCQAGSCPSPTLH